MKNNNLMEILTAIVLIGLVLLILNPFNLWMPNEVVICILIAILAVFGVLATFVLRERVLDEREGVHRMLAGRAAFLTGSGLLTLGIVVQEARHVVIDSWLVIALVAMILVKIVTRVYSDRHL